MAGGVTCSNYSILKGGPMTGNLASEYDVVTKNTNGVLVFPESHPVIMKRKAKTAISIARAKSTCCQCRMCTDLCPRNLLGMPVEPNVFMDAVANGAVGNTKAIANAMYCVSCGLCELYSCSQGLNPRSLIGEFKDKMRAEGIKPQVYDAPCNEIKGSREYRRIPMQRLKERLDLVKYDVPADITDMEIIPKRVKILMSQWIGLPAVPCVSEGESVTRGQVIANAAKGLSLPVHASMDGNVVEVNDKYIMIDRKEE
jgi:Na+-translocating ferredoxin:NAD+ oxidoreductase RnfC subunit